MGKLRLGVFLALVFLVFNLSVFGETKEYSSDAPGKKIPPLAKTANDPELVNGHVYPFWGPVCMRYTYSVVYKDKEGRPPQYVKIYFNGRMIDMTPAFDQSAADKESYQQGVRYEYKFVPNKIGPNFYYFEASNGLGKARASIIESPDNGPVLFESDFSQNEVGLIDVRQKKKIFSYPTNKSWVEQVAFSANGRYFAAKTSTNIILFATEKPEKPVWEYKLETPGQTGDMVGGVALSADGSVVAAATHGKIIVFDKTSNRPRWEGEVGKQGLKIAVSADGRYLAAVVSSADEKNTNANTLVFWETKNKKPLWRFFNIANIHDLDISANGDFLAAATGCPDRRAYIFSKNSNQPLMKSRMLTYDSPVQKARITADGSLAAFTTDGGPQSSLVYLFKKSSPQPIWQFKESSLRAGRSLAMTPDGQYIAAANMKGSLYLFSKENNIPLKHWQFPSSFGALGISSDGRLIAAGGTDKKIYLLDQKTDEKTEIVFNEFVDTLDVSADGRYVVAGTGASPYFFEEILGVDRDKIYRCETVIEPTPKFNVSDEQAKPVKTERVKFPGVLTGIGFLISFLFLCGYLAAVKLNLLRKEKENLIKVDKKIAIFLAVLSGGLLILTLIFAFFNRLDNNRFQDQKQIGSGGVCGNNLCEPDWGETKQTCPKDCSAGD